MPLWVTKEALILYKSDVLSKTDGNYYMIPWLMSREKIVCLWLLGGGKWVGGHVDAS